MPKLLACVVLYTSDVQRPSLQISPSEILMALCMTTAAGTQLNHSGFFVPPALAVQLVAGRAGSDGGMPLLSSLAETKSGS